MSLPENSAGNLTAAASQRVVNWPFLIGSLLVFAVLGGAAHYVRNWQVSRTAWVLVQRADTCETEEKWTEAAEYLHRYLQLVPGDQDVRVRLARTFRKGVPASGNREMVQRAISLYYNALATGDKREELELRHDVGELMLRIGQYLEAEQEGAKILALAEDDSVGLRLRGIGLVRQYGKGAMARESLGKVGIISALRKAYLANPRDVELAELTALALRDETLALAEIPDEPEANRFAESDACIDRLVAANPNEARPYLSRFAYRTKYGQSGAAEDIARAEELEPESVLVIVAAAQAARQEAERAQKAGNTAEAMKHLARARELYLKAGSHKLAEVDPIPLAALGEVQLAMGDKDAAVKTWTSGITKFPKAPLAFLVPLVTAHLDHNDFSKAEELLTTIDGELGRLPHATTREARLQLQRDQELRRGLFLIKSKQPQKAIAHLKQSILRQEQLGVESDESAKAWLLLAGAFAATGDWSDSGSAYDRVAGQRPKLPLAKLGAATSWLAANRPDIAVDRAEQAVQLSATANAFYTLAAAQFLHQQSLPEKDQLWIRLEKTLNEADARVSDGTLNEPWRIDLLRADYLLARAKGTDTPDKGRTQAVDILRKATEKYPAEVDFWRAVAVIFQHLSEPADADQACDHMAGLKDTASQAVITRARVQTIRKDFDRAEQVLMEAMQASSADSALLQRELINVKMARRDFTSARSLLTAALNKQPQDLGLLRLVADIDLNARDFGELPRWEQAMQETSANGQLLARYYRVRRLMADAKSKDDPSLTEAATEIARLHHLRSSSPEIAALKGMVEARLGREDSAIASFEQAIDLGEQRVAIFEQLISLLERRNRSADAEKYLTRLKSHVPFSNSLTAFESTVEIRKNQPDHAVEVAKRGVEHRPNDPAAHIWLGRMLMLNNQPQAAEAAFQRAVELEPENVRSWNGLFSFYIRQGSKEAARNALADLGSRAKLGEAEKRFVLAQGYELLESPKEAADEYRKAIALAPENVAILLRIAGFYLRSDPEESQRCLRNVLRIEPQSGIARRTLAAILAARGSEGDWAEVKKLLIDSAGQSASSSLDNRLSAILLIQRGGADNYVAAATILEDLLERPETQVPSDRMMLAQVYEKQARIALQPEQEKLFLDRARQQYVNLCARSSAQPAHLIALIEFLSRHRDSREASRWLEKLSEMRPAANQAAGMLAEQVRLSLLLGDLPQAEKWQAQLEANLQDSIIPVTLRAQIMKKQGKSPAEIGPFIDATGEQMLAAAKSEQQRLQILQSVGAVAHTVENLKLAEKWYQRLHEQSPESFELLARALAEQGRISEAMAICLDATEKAANPKAAITLSRLLISFKPNEADTKRAEALLAAAAKKYSRDSQFLFSLASLRVVQGRMEDATQLFRDVVTVNPRHVVALNNLATLLSETPNQRKEALKYIDKAIEITGTEAALFDTKGTILLFDGQTDKALEFLRAAVDSPDVDPRYRFHLALAYRDRKDVELARNELEKALQQDLEKQVLTPNEQKRLSELRSALLSP